MEDKTYWNSKIRSKIKIKPKRKKTKRIKRVKRTKRIKRIKLPSIKSLKRKADKVFSAFIRNRDKRCVLCNSVKGLSAGHLIKRGKMATRYDENNVFGLCSSCNFRDFMEQSYHDFFISWYIKKFGASSFIDLVEKSRKTIKANRLFFENIIKKYGS